MRARAIVLAVVFGACWMGVACADGPASSKTVKLGSVTPGMVACDTYSLRDYIGKGDLSLETIPALLKKLDIQAIALNDMFFKSWDSPYLDRIKKACADNGIIIACLIMEGNLASDDGNARKRQIEENTKKLKAAGYLGAPAVRMNLGGAGSAEKDATVGVERVIDAFKQMLPLAQELNVRITMENHGGVSGTAENLIKIIEGTDPAWVGSCLDFGNWPGNVRYESCDKMSGYCYHTHAKTHSFTADGEAEGVDYGRILGKLREQHIPCAVSIEFEGGGDQIDGVVKTRDLIRKHWDIRREGADK